MFRLMKGGIDKQSFLTLTEKTSQRDFLQVRQQNVRILTYPINKLGPNSSVFRDTYLNYDHFSI